MIRAIRTVTTLRGRDPGAYTLIAFGGAGGLHAVALARALGVAEVVVPSAAGVFSALGLLLSDLELSRSAAFLRPLPAVDAGDLTRRFDALAAEVLGRLGRAAGDVRLRRRADLRYAGQAFELTVDVPDGPLDDAALAVVSQAFDAEHERTYGHSLPASHRRDLVALRVSGTAAGGGSAAIPRAPARAGDAWANGERRAFFGPAGWLATPVIGRGALGGAGRAGPLIVEEADSTTVVPPGCRARLDDAGAIVIAAGRPA